MDIQAKNPSNEEAPAVDLTDGEVNQIQNSVGGEKDYNKMITWASENMEQAQLQAFNKIINIIKAIVDNFFCKLSSIHQGTLCFVFAYLSPGLPTPKIIQLSIRKDPFFN